MMKKFFSVLLALCLVVGLAPVDAQAAGGEKAIQLVDATANKTGGITSEDQVYYGSWVNGGAAETSPLKWLVLDTKTNTGSDGLFLLSDALLDNNSNNGGVYFQKDYVYNSNDGKYYNVTVHLTFKPCTVVYFDSDSSNWEYVWARVYDERGNNIALDTSRKDHRGYSVLNVPDGYTKIFFQNVVFGAPYEAQMTAKMEIVPNRVYAYLIQSPTEDETITVYEGDMATMAIETKDGLTYQWQINYNDGTGWHNCGENSPVYTSSPTKLSNSGYRYRCQVTSTTGAICTSHIFTLEVLEKIELPETGDSSNPLLWLTMSLLSLLGIVLMRRKCEQ